MNNVKVGQAAQSLADQLRLDELKAIPMAEKSEGQLKEYNRLSKRLHRSQQKTEDSMPSLNSPEELWSANLSTIPPAKLAEYKSKQERVLEILELVKGVEDGTIFTAPEFSEYSQEEIISNIVMDIEESIKSNGVVRFGYIYSDPEIPSDCWSKFYKDKALFRLLCAEGLSTELHAKFGFTVGLPDFRVVRFLTEHCGWDWLKSATLVGWKLDRFGTCHAGPSVVDSDTFQEKQMILSSKDKTQCT